MTNETKRGCYTCLICQFNTDSWPEMIGHRVQHQGEEQKAYDRLTSAAPEMLAALKAAEHWMRTNITDGAGLVFNQMLEAINKAEGRE